VAKDDVELPYQPLWDHLEEVGATKILYSEWVLVGNTGQAAIWLGMHFFWVVCLVALAAACSVWHGGHR
jgi:hypothetical protein